MPLKFLINGFFILLLTAFPQFTGAEINKRPATYKDIYIATEQFYERLGTFENLVRFLELNASSDDRKFLESKRLEVTGQLPKMKSTDGKVVYFLGVDTPITFHYENSSLTFNGRTWKANPKASIKKNLEALKRFFDSGQSNVKLSYFSSGGEGMGSQCPSGGFA